MVDAVRCQCGAVAATVRRTYGISRVEEGTECKAVDGDRRLCDGDVKADGCECISS